MGNTFVGKIYSYKMKRFIYSLILIVFFSTSVIYGQETFKLSSAEIEALFLKQNLKLVAEQMNIDIADAEIVQAKLWDNPNLSISGVNLWSTSGQRDGKSEVIPPLFGNFAKNTQFSIELSQMIQTANKRGKLIAREKVSKEIAVQEFETVLRGMKIELRKSINEIIYLQNYQTVLYKQQQSLAQLIQSYQKQVNQGNLAKAELLRLQSSLLEIDNEWNDISTDLNEQLKTLKTLLSVDPLVNIEIEGEGPSAINPDSLVLSQLLSQATEFRTDLKLNKLQTQYFDKTLVYEKSQRIPDITFSVNYDRFGGVWRDFIGFGVSFDLPFLNRNQGAIKAARISRDQSLSQEKQQVNQIQHEVVEAYNNYCQSFLFYRKISNNDLLADLDNMLGVYTKNLLNRNIGMLEFIDFMDTYKNSKQTVLIASKKMHSQFEELQYITGTKIE